MGKPPISFSGEGTVARNASTTIREAQHFAPYLVNRPCPEDLAVRYTRAIGKLQIADSAALRWVRRMPWLLGFLDAGCGLIRSDDPLRQRLLVMAAILEASPSGYEDFVSRAQEGRVVTLVCLYAGIRGAVKALIGVPLVLLIGRGR